jgi:hypothetical protein
MDETTKFISHLDHNPWPTAGRKKPYSVYCTAYKQLSIGGNITTQIPHTITQFSITKETW